MSSFKKRKTADKEQDILIEMKRFLIVYLTDSLANYLGKIMHTNLCNQLLVICVAKNNSCNYVDFSTSTIHELAHLFAKFDILYWMAAIIHFLVERHKLKFWNDKINSKQVPNAQTCIFLEKSGLVQTGSFFHYILFL